jgi:hypothetical protein
MLGFVPHPNLRARLRPPPVSGTLTQNTWFAPGSTVIEGDLIVPAGITLTLQAGAQLRFAGNDRIAVEGTLRVLGSAASPVVFTSDQPQPAARDWKGIEIRASATDVSIDHARIEYTDWGCLFWPWQHRDGKQQHLALQSLRHLRLRRSYRGEQPAACGQWQQPVRQHRLRLLQLLFRRDGNDHS